MSPSVNSCRHGPPDGPWGRQDRCQAGSEPHPLDPPLPPHTHPPGEGEAARCYDSVMEQSSEERRIAALLRELIEKSGTALVSVEERLGWEPGRLATLLDGLQGVSFEVLLEVLPALDETPGDFFARLCGFDPE